MGGHVLIVDDQLPVGKMLTFLLEHYGFTTDYAQDGIEAEMLFRQKHYDAVLSDLQMPKMHGYELCKRIKEYNPHIPFLLLSGSDEASREKMRIPNTRPDVELSKPCDNDILVSELNTLIQKYETMQLRVENLN